MKDPRDIKLVEIKFYPSGRGKARNKPNPRYPNGQDIVVLPPKYEGPTCKFALQYPAPECGHFIIDCLLCGVRGAVTAAGRPDDPKSITIPCNFNEGE